MEADAAQAEALIGRLRRTARDPGSSEFGEAVRDLQRDKTAQALIHQSENADDALRQAVREDLERLLLGGGDAQRAPSQRSRSKSPCMRRVTARDGWASPRS